ncbi:magnesium transporter CorA family protein, partial [Patescibacteria group bacterium]|nr:magnesium transporter CorA family protein [Patescibacteria group bacterium]
KYLFIVLQFPTYNKRHRRFDTEQLNIFIGQNYLITLHNGNLTALNEIFERCRKSIKSKKLLFGESTGYLLYEIISALLNDVFPSTDNIQVALKKIEEDIFEPTHPKDQLFNIMVIKKNIISLRKIMLPQRSVIAALEHKQKRFLPEDLVIYFDDIVDQIEKLWNILETQKEVIESLEDTNESLLSHNINLTMRTLTVFSVIMLPLTFLTGLFGMNVQLPFADALSEIEHFWKIIVVMGTLVVVMFGIFKWRKWL